MPATDTENGSSSRCVPRSASRPKTGCVMLDDTVRNRIIRPSWVYDSPNFACMYGSRTGTAPCEKSTAACPTVSGAMRRASCGAWRIAIATGQVYGG